MRSLNRPKPEVSVERRADGTQILTSPRALPENLPLMIDLLARAAERRPELERQHAPQPEPERRRRAGRRGRPVRRADWSGFPGVF